jgi:hypothetical protein
MLMRISALNGREISRWKTLDDRELSLVFFTDGIKQTWGEVEFMRRLW